MAAKGAYEHLNWETAVEDAHYLIGLLRKLGWLETHGTFMSTAHDVVADEVLEQTIHSNSVVFYTELSAVLSCTFQIPHGIGRMATALRRVFGSVRNRDEADAIEQSLQQWLTINAFPLGQIFQSGDPDQTGYALGTLLGGPPWEDPAIRKWQDLFAPWLTAHGKEEARHLLYIGLKKDPINRPWHWSSQLLHGWVNMVFCFSRASL